MSSRRARHRFHPGPRHSASWYDQSGEDEVLAVGDRIFVACEGGPCQSRLEAFPPRFEIEEKDGVYVLDGDGPRSTWRYRFVVRSL